MALPSPGGGPVKALAIAGVAVRRLLRDRSNIFFVFLLPLLLILVLGVAFGGEFDPRVGVVAVDSGALGEDLAERFRAVAGISVRDKEDAAEMKLAIERGQLEAGVVIPEGYDSALRAGEAVSVEFIARAEESNLALKNTIESVVIEQGALVRAAALAEAEGTAPFSDALETARDSAESAEGLAVRQSTVGEPFVFDKLGRFDLGAYSQLLLFVFLTSMTGSTALIQSRQLGVSTRMLSTPTSVGTILLGEGLGRFGVAMVQGLLIIAGTSIAFGVDWGDPLGATAVFLVFSLGASGVGMLMGAVFRNDQQAGGAGVMIGIGLGALGGCMLPLSIMKVFSEPLWRAAHVTPHAWGIEAFEELILNGGTIADIWLELAVLASFAVVVFALGVWRLRVALTR